MSGEKEHFLTASSICNIKGALTTETKSNDPLQEFVTSQIVTPQVQMRP